MYPARYSAKVSRSLLEKYLGCCYIFLGYRGHDNSGKNDHQTFTVRMNQENEIKNMDLVLSCEAA